MEVLLIAVCLQMAGGLAAALAGRWPRAATAFGAGAAVLAAGLGLGPALGVLLGTGAPRSFWAAWDPLRGPFHLELDALAAAFLVPVQALSALAAVYGAGYLLAYRDKRSLGPPWLFFNVFVAGMSVVLLARTAFLFLFAWEIMSLAAYFLVTFEHDRPEVRRAGWVYLVAAHLGAACLIGAFVLLGREAGGLGFPALAATPPPDPAVAGVVLVLAVLGFGAKAGLVPLHVWLPEAHPAAPSHVSALLSGVMIKLGLYGLLRVLGFLGEPAAWWGPALGVLGLTTAVYGIALAACQRDLKRVLAYSSIENVGLIVLALGVGLWGRATGRAVVASLGVTAALLHVWNHALMKGLLFLSAGSVVHGAGTKDMERLGGLLRRMPWTGGLMILGAVAIAALPPLNGFAGKWLLYLGLLEVGLSPGEGRGLVALLAVGMLALVGGLAAVAFVRVCGVALLGSPRGEAAGRAHESSPWLLGPMVALALGCLVSAAAPDQVADLLRPAIRQVLGGPVGGQGHGLATLGRVQVWTMAALLLGGGLWWLWLRRGPVSEGPTWGCGYARPTPRMQYTARSFGELLAGHLLPGPLRPRAQRRPPEGLFPAASGAFSSATPDPVSEGVYEPFFARCARRLAGLRVLQQGSTQVYLVYILAAVILGLAWASLQGWLLGGAE